MAYIVTIAGNTRFCTACAAACMLVVIEGLLVYCHVLNAHIRASQMVHSQAQLAGNGEYPCQELQRRCGPFVGLPSGEALSGHLRCCIGLT